MDDEWMVATEVERSLRRAGYAIPEIVTTAARAMGAFERLRPDLVLLDISLDRDADGVAIAAKIRACSRTPIVFLSGKADTATVKRAIGTSPQGFVVKPFTEAQLLAALELALTPATDDSGTHAALNALDRIAAVLADAGCGGTNELDFARVPALTTLSTREREILRRFLAHQRVAGVARALSISEHTVRNHLKSMYAKLGVHSQEELLDFVVRGPSRR
ncbi:MAG: response regulator [Polyangiales bacterium]